MAHDERLPAESDPETLDCTDPFARDRAIYAEAKVRSDGVAVIRLPSFYPFDRQLSGTSEAELDAFIGAYQAEMQKVFDTDGSSPIAYDALRYALYDVEPGGPFTGRIPIDLDGPPKLASGCSRERALRRRRAPRSLDRCKVNARATFDAGHRAARGSILSMKSIYLFFAVTLGACIIPSSGAPRRLTQQRLGDVCSGGGDCASGLSCMSAQLDPWDRSWPGGNLCTVPCDGAACPAGTTCVAAPPGSGAARQICVPTCGADGDCQRGERAQICAPAAQYTDRPEALPRAPVQVLASLPPGASVCQSLRCLAGGSAACNAPNCTRHCPEGFACVAQPKTFGWCQRP